MNRKLIIFTVIFVCIDQITKFLADAYLSAETSVIVIKNFFSLTYVNNFGAAWGILSGKSILLVIVSLVALLLIYRETYFFKMNKRNIIAFGLVISGIFGNLIDRLFFGYVRDFLDFNIFGYNYPVFNIADSCLVVGAILLVIAIFKGEDRTHESNSKGK